MIQGGGVGIVHAAESGGNQRGISEGSFMKSKWTVVVCAVALAFIYASGTRASTLITFEEFVGFDKTNIGTFYSGISFESGGSGSDWVGRDSSVGGYNVSSYPSGTGGEYWIHGFGFATTALDASGNDGIIRFTNRNASYVSIAYSALSTFTLEAYDSEDNKIDEDAGEGNLRYYHSNTSGPGILRVESNSANIAYVRVHDSGNQWLIDNLQTDATGIVFTPPVVPLPLAAWGGIVLFGCLVARNRLARKT
jgi:hypothetical protein